MEINSSSLLHLYTLHTQCESRPNNTKFSPKKESKIFIILPKKRVKLFGRHLFRKNINLHRTHLNIIEKLYT